MVNLLEVLDDADDALGYAKGGDASTDEDHGWALIAIAGYLRAIASVQVHDALQAKEDR